MLAPSVFERDVLPFKLILEYVHWFDCENMMDRAGVVPELSVKFSVVQGLFQGQILSGKYGKIWLQARIFNACEVVFMQWIAPSEKDMASETLGKRHGNAAYRFQANSTRMSLDWDSRLITVCSGCRISDTPSVIRTSGD